MSTGAVIYQILIHMALAFCLGVLFNTRVNAESFPHFKASEVLNYE